MSSIINSISCCLPFPICELGDGFPKLTWCLLTRSLERRFNLDGHIFVKWMVFFPPSSLFCSIFQNQQGIIFFDILLVVDFPGELSSEPPSWIPKKALGHSIFPRQLFHLNFENCFIHSNWTWCFNHDTWNPIFVKPFNRSLLAYQPPTNQWVFFGRNRHWKALDADKSGQLDHEELRHGLEKLGLRQVGWQSLRMGLGCVVFWRF